MLTNAGCWPLVQFECQFRHCRRRRGILVPVSSHRETAITALDRRIHHEQIRLIYNQGPVLVLGATLCAAMTTLFLWQHRPASLLLVWLAGIVFSAVFRLMIFHRFRRASDERRQQPCWGPLFWISALLAGMIWGAWPLFFHQLYDTEYLLLISTIFAGLVAVSAGAGTIYLPAFAAFTTPLVLPLLFSHLLSGSDTLAITGVLLLMFLTVNWFLAARGNQQFGELIRARYENQELMMRLEDEKAIADRAVIAKSRFLAAASHDLRQPLHAMGLFLGALRNRENDAKQLEIIDDMARSSEALNGLFTSLLDVSRLDADIIVVENVHLPVHRLFEGLRAQFRQQAVEKGLDLQVSDTQEVLWTDAVLFERIVRNLIANALQYTQRGHVQLSCHRSDAGTVTITLCDTGIGIPGHARDDVFSEYYQLDNPERDRTRGLGLGLSIVQRLCKLLDVELRMESVEGQGTRFDLTVPAGKASRVVDSGSLPMQRDFTACKVLVIDDEQQVLDSMRHVLEQWGCEVWLALSARMALRLLATADASPDIILSDCRLRDEEDGIDAIVAIRESLAFDAPAALITGDTTSARLQEMVGNPLPVLYKPVQPRELYTLLDALIPHETPALPAVHQG